MTDADRAAQDQRVAALSARMDQERNDYYATLTADQLRTLAQGERDAAQRLIDQYGEGIRPSWVSTDIAINYDKARRFDLAATAKETQHFHA